MRWCCYCHAPTEGGSDGWHLACREEAAQRQNRGMCVACGERAGSFHGTCMDCVSRGGRYRNYPGVVQ